MEAQETKEVEIGVTLTLTKTFKFKMSQEEIEELKIDDIIDNYLLNEFIEKQVILPQDAWHALQSCACVGNVNTRSIEKKILDLKDWDVYNMETTSYL